MSDRDDILREIASVRRDLENLGKEVSTADGAMPSTNNPADAGLQNFRLVLKRLETIEEMAGDTADKLRAVLRELEP